MLKAQDLARYFMAFLTDGVHHFGDCLQVGAGSGLSVNINKGFAHIQGRMLGIFEDINGSTYNVPLPAANAQYARIDRIVLRMDLDPAVNGIIPVVLTGTAAASPVPPPLTRTSNRWELSLAQVRLNANAVSISPANITDERTNTILCGQMNSTMGLDPSLWQAAFDSFMASCTSSFDTEQTARSTTFSAEQTDRDNTFNVTQAARQTTFINWFNGTQTDLARATPFDFDNLAVLPGNLRFTVFYTDGSVTETIADSVNGNTLALRTTTFPSGKIIEDVTIYAADGKTVVQHTKTTTTFNTDGTISEVVTA